VNAASLQVSSASGWLIACLVAAVLVVLLVSCSREVGEKDLFFPRQHAVVPEEPGQHNVVITYNDEEALRGWYLEKPAHDTTLIFHYGNGETVLANAARLAWFVDTLGVNVMAVDYRGYGFSDGSPSVDALLEDTVRIYDHLRAEWVDASHRIIVYGRSIGSAPAVHLAAERRVDGLILEAPFTNISDVISAWGRNIKAPVRWFIRLRPESSLAEQEPQPEDLIAAFTGPLLVIHGEADTVIPATLGREMFEACPSEAKTWISLPGIGHNNLPVNHPDVVPALQRFVSETVPKNES
jgi:pimeloyl-ACP methyl ester carboxylesterase